MLETEIKKLRTAVEALTERLDGIAQATTAPAPQAAPAPEPQAAPAPDPQATPAPPQRPPVPAPENPVPPPGQPSQAEVALATLKTAAASKAQQLGSHEKIVEVLQAAGVTKMSDLDPSQYATVLAQIEALQPAGGA